MTGELTLTGKVLPIGGVKEKTIAARMSGVKTLIFPKDNHKDFEELPVEVKEGFEVFFVDYYKDVYEIAFEDKKAKPKGMKYSKKK
jgi:ATP-dependent Lon protease